MGHRTGIYLKDDLEARWRASGAGLPELVRRGLDAGDPDEVLVRAAAQAVVADLERIVDRVAARAAREVAEALLEDQREAITRAVRSALADAQGGGY